MSTLNCQQPNCPVRSTTPAQGAIEIRCWSNSFPEHYYQVPPQFKPEYCRRVLRGHEVAPKIRAVILGLARNVGHVLPTVTKHIAETGRMFADYRTLIFENDSRDDTVAVLQRWHAQDSARNWFSSQTMDRMDWTVTRSGCQHRTQDMADYRNLCWERFEACRGDFEPDVVLLFDLDIYGWSYEGLLHTLGHWEEFDGMFSNGLKTGLKAGERHRYFQYDSFAWRQDGYGMLNDNHTHHTSVINRLVPARGTPLIPVYSAFGGLGVYPAAVYRKARYSGEDCEHVIFHRRLHEAGHRRMFVNPSQVLLYEPPPR